ncbi:MAG: DUF2071 domain-containing protein [Chitinophagaceae bacterium]|nr:DUF2071 domain-containing protein [Chitinophagaceae bacterium]
MANYTIDAAALQPYPPAKSEIDLFNDKVYMSLVGFMFMNTRLFGFKIPSHINFEEVNLRFYVRYCDNGQWKRGTVFIKETVHKPDISFIDNAICYENYCTKMMRHCITETTHELPVNYEWKHNSKWNTLMAIVNRTAHSMITRSEDAIIAAHFQGYLK